MLAPCIAPAEVRVFRPDDTYVIARLGDRGEDLAKLRAWVARSPRDTEALRRYVQALVATARRLGNERYYGFAERAIVTALPEVRAALALEHANLLQARHDFGAAEALLSALLTQDAQRREALLMRAQVRVHLNLPSAAMADCLALVPMTDLLVSTTCIAQARAGGGELDKSYALVAAVLEQVVGRPDGNASNQTPWPQSDSVSWSASVAAEFAARLGKVREATQWYRMAFELNPTNHFARLAYADWLLDQERYSRANRVAAAGHSLADLLRVVLAGDSNDNSLSRRLQLAWHEAELRGDREHLRDRARFELSVLHDAKRAHATALDNFSDHRTADDALLLARTAVLADDAGVATELKHWMLQRHYSDVRLERLLQLLQAQSSTVTS